MLSTAKVRAIASVIAIGALSLQGLSPATAADPEATNEPATESTAAPTETATPTPAETTTPAQTETPAESESDEPPAEPDDIPYPPAEDAEGLVDVKLPDRNVPIDPLPNPVGSLLANLNYLNLGKTGKTSPPGDFYDGSAVGLYFEADVLGLLKVKSRKLGAVYMHKSVTKYGEADRALVASANPEFWPLPYAEARIIESQTRTGGNCQCGSSPFRAYAEATTKVAKLRLEALDVDGIEVTALARQTYPSNDWETTANVRFARLKLGSTVYNNPDIAPNTTHKIAGLGTVVLNEQKITENPGVKHAAKVTAIHITLSTAKLGLPVGTDIYIGSAEAAVNA